MEDDRIRAGDADRDAVLQILNTAYAAGRITATEHTERCDAALVAKTFGDLRPLTADLVPTPMPETQPSPTRAIRAPSQNGFADRERQHVFEVNLDKLQRSGDWRVPARMKLSAFVATIELDLTRAELPGPVIEIECAVVMSTLRMWVPPGTNVQDDTNPVPGERAVRRIGPYDAQAPLIVLTGSIVLSDLKIQGPRGPRGPIGVLGL